MKQSFYERIGESVYRETLPNGLQIFVVPKPDYAKSYAFFATRYGGMDTRRAAGPQRSRSVWHRPQYKRRKRSCSSRGKRPSGGLT